MAEKDYVILGINVSVDERERVHEIARSRGYKITSDYIRALIEADAQVHGDNFKFDIDRGGNRREKGG